MGQRSEPISTPFARASNVRLPWPAGGRAHVLRDESTPHGAATPARHARRRRSRLRRRSSAARSRRSAYEVATHLGRCASSAIINQSNERNASVLDGAGRLAGISVGIPQLLFISPLSVRYGLEHRDADDWGPGDVFVGNDPEHGGGHLPDYNVYAPVYDAARRDRADPGAAGASGRHRRQGSRRLLGGRARAPGRRLDRAVREARASRRAPARHPRAADAQQPLPVASRAISPR